MGKNVSKLNKLKEKLTISDTARDLANFFDEEVTEADVLQLALDKKLQLSVYFPSLAIVRPEKIVEYNDAELRAATEKGIFPEELDWLTLDPAIIEVLPSSLREAGEIKYPLSVPLGDNRYLTWSSEVKTVVGVCDLPLLGDELFDIERKYQILIGEEPTNKRTPTGAIVKLPSGEFAQLQAKYDDNEDHPGSLAQLEQIHEILAEQDLSPADTKKLLDEFKQNQIKFLTERSSRPPPVDYYCCNLPEDSVFVVRPAALEEFKQTNGASVSNKKLGTNERNTLLITIAALCRQHSGINIKERGAAGKIARMTEELGAGITEETIRKILEKISEALESRMK